MNIDRRTLAGLLPALGVLAAASAHAASADETALGKLLEEHRAALAAAEVGPVSVGQPEFAFQPGSAAIDALAGRLAL